MSEQTRASALERVLVGVLAVAVLLAAAVLVRVLVAGDPAALPEGNTPIVAGASITSAEAKQESMVAAAEATRKVLSYTAETLDADIEAARATLAGDMLGRYADTMERIREQAEDGTAVEATVVARSIISATEHDAKVLLFVNQSTTGPGLDEPRVERNRVVVTLHRDGADWLVTALDAI